MFDQTRRQYDVQAFLSTKMDVFDWKTVIEKNVNFNW